MRFCANCATSTSIGSGEVGEPEVDGAEEAAGRGGAAAEQEGEIDGLVTAVGSVLTPHKP